MNGKTRSFEDIEKMFAAGPPQMPVKDPTNRVVLFETLWYDEADGWAVASRGHARAMLDAGIDIRMQSWMPLMSKHLDQGEIAQLSREELEAMVVPQEKLVDMINPRCLAEIGGVERIYRRGDPWGLYIFSTTLGGPAQIESSLNILLNYPSPRVFYTMFERCHVAPETVRQLKQLDGIWVLCEKNAEELRRHGLKPVVIPPCYRDDDPVLLARRYFPPIEQGFLKFYWIGRNEPRKAMDNVVRAFLRAFTPNEASLTLKMSPIGWRGDTLSVEQVVEQEMQDPALLHQWWSKKEALSHINIVEGRFSRQEMAAFHAGHHVYVSASRGEGWDLPAFEAKLVGNRVISTDSGGPRDFLLDLDGDHLIRATGEILAHERYRWGPGATYIDYDLNDIVLAMRMCKQEKQPVRPLGHMERYRQAHVGNDILSWVKGFWK